MLRRNGWIEILGGTLAAMMILVGCGGGSSSVPSNAANSVALPSEPASSTAGTAPGHQETPPAGSQANPPAVTPPQPVPPTDPAPPVVNGWVLKEKETFDAPLPAGMTWAQDTYGRPGDPWEEDGDFFIKKYDKVKQFEKSQGISGNPAPTFRDALGTFGSYRKSFAYGRNGWLTIELYGRDVPQTGGGGEFLIGESAGNHYLQLNDKTHTDGAEVRSTEPLPSEYRIRLKVTPISAGGRDDDGVWRKNGYSDGNESAGPWRFTNASTQALEAWKENGFYFLTILDTKPMPHNDVWIHHHRKVVIDSDNNVPPSWSKIWDGGKLITEGSHPVSMLALDGNSFGSVWTGNTFHCVYNGGFQMNCGGNVHAAADAYINGETYTVTIERNKTGYVLEVSGKFRFGGETTYRGEIDFRKAPVWHYNNTAADSPKGKNGQPLKDLGIDWNSWPEDSAYPDYFMFGDPHITHYEGTVRYDDLELWVRP